MTALPSEIVSIATAEIGVVEDGTSNTAVRVNEYKAATRLDPAEEWPWCSAFICWVVKAALKETGTPETATFRRPTTAAAWGLESWSLAQDKTTQTKRHPHDDIRPGDLICFTFSHCAIAASSPDDDGWFATIEGNTSPGTAGSQRDGGGVYRRRRRTSQVRSRIRFTV